MILIIKREERIERQGRAGRRREARGKARERVVLLANYKNMKQIF